MGSGLEIMDYRLSLLETDLLAVVAVVHETICVTQDVVSWRH
jgi:hypothetical protein